MWPGGDLVGQQVKVIDEKLISIFYAPAKVVAQRGDEVLLEFGEIFHKVAANRVQLELQPPLVVVPKIKQLRLPKYQSKQALARKIGQPNYEDRN